jgi:hypothetical protein
MLCNSSIPQFPNDNLVSGIDGMFLLGNITDEEAIDRALGKVQDQLTGEQYHLEMNPPPLEDPT